MVKTIDEIKLKEIKEMKEKDIAEVLESIVDMLKNLEIRLKKIEKI